MNKIYLFASLFLAAGTVSAQEKIAQPEVDTKVFPKGEQRILENTNPNRAVLFSEDFSNGLAGQGANGAWTTSGADGNIWMKDYDGGVQGQYWGTGTPIASASAANGFMIFDCDSSNNPGTAATFQNREGQLVSPIIDLTASNNVNIEFTQSFRWCCFGSHEILVEVSNDGGATWPGSYSAKGAFETNDRTGTHQISLNISAVAGGQDSVMVRFNWQGASTASHYYWMLDDVEIVDSPDHEIMFTETGFRTSALDIWGDKLPFTMVPLSQITGNDVEFWGRMTNQGSNSEDNLTIRADVYNGSNTNVFTGAGNAQTLALFDTLYDSTNTFALTTVETYTADVYFTYDSSSLDYIPSNDSAAYAFQVTDYTYGRDNGLYTGSYIWNGDDGAATPSANAFTIGTEYTMTASETLNKIQVAFSSASEVGAVVYPVIIELDPAAADFQGILANVVYDGSLLGSGYALTASDISASPNVTWVDFPIAPQGLQLNAGSSYAICIATQGGESARIMNANVNSPDATNFLYDAVGNNANNSVQWFWIPSTPMIRADFTPVAWNVEENNNIISLEQNVPNPFNATSNISFTLTQAADVTLDIVDVTGKLVYSLNEGNKGAGTHTITLNSANIAAGTYSYTLRAGDFTATKKMLITK